MLLQTQADKAKLVGPGLLVVDTADKQATDPTNTYIVGVSDSAVGLVRGGQVPSDNTVVCGRVLFCCRPAHNVMDNSEMGMSAQMQF